ncbi:MAG: I78 family peptidase inhibitor [Burkholderiaceae bacterium]
MRICFYALAATSIGLGLLAGCAAPFDQGNAAFPSPGPRGGVCNAGPAQAVIGKQGTASVVEQARVLSGAAMARVLRQGQAVTLEFNAERLNLTVDAQGRITAVRCG